LAPSRGATTNLAVRQATSPSVLSPSLLEIHIRLTPPQKAKISSPKRTTSLWARRSSEPNEASFPDPRRSWWLVDGFGCY
ncbi:MAG: hypothetical protein WCN98_15135, partial [Verrucomicrobiaceae bacterium]